MSLEVYFAAVPWALPTLAVAAALVVLLSGRVARRWDWSRWEVVVLGVSLAAFLAITTTPVPRAGRPMDATRTVDLAAALIPPRILADLHYETALNVWLTVPLGFAAGYVALRRRRAWPVLVAVLVPPACELFQLAFPPLGRSAFLLGDVVANWQGVVMGGVLGTLAAVLVRLSASTPAGSRGVGRRSGSRGTPA